MLKCNEWYKTFFSEAYWTFAEWEYSAKRTKKEVDYIEKVLRQYINLNQNCVVDLGCGLGRHSINLAKRGFSVQGIDVSSWVLKEASRRCPPDVTNVMWRNVDLIKNINWFSSSVDAAVSIQSFGWGDDGDQLRFLRQVRRHLKPGGIFILDHSNPAYIFCNYMPYAEITLNKIKYIFNRAYNPVTGRSKGTITIKADDGTEQVLHHDIRLYATAEILSLLQRAGFEILHVDGNFVLNGLVNSDTRYVQIIARACQVPPYSLSFTKYNGVKVFPSDYLDLRWSPDESEWCYPTPISIWEACIKSKLSWNVARRYTVDEPYGNKELTFAIAKQFGSKFETSQITCGAGVISLLHSLCNLADQGTILCSSLSFADLSAWGVIQGASIFVVSEYVDVDGFKNYIAANKPALVYLERPTILGKLFSLNDLSQIIKLGKVYGTLIMVDESNLNYLKSSLSAIRLVNEAENLIVLRGLAKGYAAGGLRLGYAVTSLPISAWIREHIPPLQVSELSMRTSLSLINAGDIFSALRKRIHTVKPEVQNFFTKLGLTINDTSAQSSLPWLMVSNDIGNAQHILDEYKIVGKEVVSKVTASGKKEKWLRLSVPLSDKRVLAFRQRVNFYTSL